MITFKTTTSVDWDPITLLSFHVPNSRCHDTKTAQTVLRAPPMDEQIEVLRYG